MTKLLVASGYEVKSVEIINLDSDNPDLICDSLPDLPYGRNGAIGVNLPNILRAVFSYKRVMLSFSVLKFCVYIYFFAKKS